jgi:hypothetical protein
MLVPLGSELVEPRIAVRGDVGQVDHAVLVALFEHLVEDRAPPAFGGIPLLSRAVLETFWLVGLDIVPAEAAALENRVQRVDHDEPIRKRDSLGAAAFAKTSDQIVFRQTGQTLADQPVHQAQAGREFHGRDYAARTRSAEDRRS